jgi:outer membrane protein OmpA-like peptidoglycan-associated protein
MRLKGLALAGALLLASATPGMAQKAGAFELGAFGRYTWFDKDLNFDNRVGVGGRLGIFVLPNLEVEGDASYTATESQTGDFVRYIPIHARLVYNLPAGEHSALLIGAGYTHNLFRRAYRETEKGAGGLVGLRLGTGDVISIRIDGTLDYIFDPESRFGDTGNGVQNVGVTPGTDKNWHWGLQAGLSAMFGARRDGDRDKDGVKDSLDQCPNTPLGDQVDANGCSLPKDADGDGVADNLDRCPNTPAGTAVDAAGCPKDSDGDGVTDGADKCPNTPAGTAVDASGCPKDSDADGVADGADKCPNTPAGTPVDANGCPKDSDSDGVADTLDKCPNTPAGTTVDASGCPSDSDGDGVANANDKCPNTPPGTKVDAVGCTELFTGGTTLVLEGVYFETGKSAIKAESGAVLDRVAESLVGNPDVKVEVGGHTDNTGSKATNTRLSTARAKAVMDYLISKGVDKSRLTAVGYGPTKPVADNKTVAGRAANRRVELTKVN